MTDSAQKKRSMADRLNEILLEKGIRAAALARALNLSRGTVSRILSGKTARPDYSFFAGMQTHFGVNPQWLADGIGEKEAQQGFATDATSVLRECDDSPAAIPEDAMETGAVDYVLAEMSDDQLLSLIRRVKRDERMTAQKKRVILSSVALELGSRHERKKAGQRINPASDSHN